MVAAFKCFNMGRKVSFKDMKKIGFVDYYISEWHANNYPLWIDKVCKKLGYDYKVCYAYAEKYDSSYDGRNTDKWCEDFGVEKCNTIKELCDKSDFVIVLAPSNPETHVRLCQEAFQAGKRCYVDKTFAEDYKSAKAIFDCADKYGVKFFSTSALRYADELQSYKNEKRISVKGGGSNFDEYIIHQIEMAVRVIGTGAVSAVAENTEQGIKVQISYPDDRAATLLFDSRYDFEADVTDKSGKTTHQKIESSFFDTLIEKIILFFETGNVDFDTNDTLEVIKIREGAILAKNNIGKKIEF